MRKKNDARGVQDLLRFKLCDNHIEVGNRLRYYLRIHPANMVILNLHEKMEELRRFKLIMDSSDSAFELITIDKAENLDEIYDYYQMLTKMRPEYAFINESICEFLRSNDIRSASIQRAFYFLITVREERDFDIVFKTFSNHIKVEVAKKLELTQIMRSSLLREFIDSDVYSFEGEIDKRYEENLKKRKPMPKVKITEKQRQKYKAAEALKPILDKPEALPETTYTEKEASQDENDKSSQTPAKKNTWPFA